MDSEEKNAEDLADYIAELSAELARMAASAGWHDLAETLEKAHLESERLCN